MMKKFFCALLCVALLAPAALAAYPDKPITNVIPAAAGGGYDMNGRIVTDAWGKLLGQPFRYDYKPGASSMIGLRVVANDATGYSVGVVALNQVNVVAKTQKNAPATWDNMAFIGNITTDPDAVFVHKDSPFQTIQELIAYGKENTLKVGTAHPSAVSSIAARAFIKETGIKATIVSFNGGNDSRKALAGKHVDMVVSIAGGALNMKDFFRGLVVFDEKNPVADTYPMPTMKEALPEIDFPIFVEPDVVCISKAFADAHPEDYARMCETFKAAIEAESSIKQAETLGYTPLMDYRTPEQCRQYSDDFDKTLEKYADILMVK